MKKIACLAMILALCVSLAACYAGEDSAILRQPAGGFFEDLDLNGIFGFGSSEKDSQMDTSEEKVKLGNSYMPNFVNQDISSAEEQLNEMNIAFSIEYEFHDSYEENRVISQSIAPGTELYGYESVTLIVSAGKDVCPYNYSQKLVVSAARGSSYATASFYEWYNGDWQLQRTYSATVGSNGIGQPYEGSRRTPQGLFKLGVVLSARSLNTNMQTYYASSSTCVVDDPDSYYYNCIMDTSQVPYGTDVDPIGKGLNNGTSYAFIYIEHNGTGLSPNGVVPGAGSVMGIDGTYKALAPTYGDVDISVADMQDLLSRLDSTKNPMIEITTY